jgi:hypothetical protein
MVVASKMDALDELERLDRLKAFCAGRGLELLEISSVTGLGIQALIYKLGQQIEELRIKN